MTQQTAVDFLITELGIAKLIEIEKLAMVQEVVIKAKAMEKEQIIDAYEKGVGDENERNLSGQFTNAEQYYDETYNK